MAIKEKINQAKIEQELNDILKDLDLQIVIPEEKEDKDKKKDNKKKDND